MADSLNSYSIYNKYFAERVDVNKFSFKDAIKVFYNYDAVRRLKKLIREEKPDIAHLHNIYHHLSPAIISTLKKNEIPIVQTLHDYKIICPNYKLFSSGKICDECKGKKYYNCFLKKCVKNSGAKSILAMAETYLHNSFFRTYDKIDQFIAPSEFLKNVIIDFGIPHHKIRMIHNFIDFYPLVLDKNKGDSSDNFLLYFGRLSNEKGINLIFEALLKTRRNISLKIAGEGPELKNLEKLATELNLKEKVEFMGMRHGNDLKELIHSAKAIIMPSVCQENMPYSLLESLAMGKIVIASSVGGIKEVITDEINGVLFEAGSSFALAGKIDKLDEFDLEKISIEAKRTIMKFNSEKHYGKIMEIYNQLVNR